MATLLCVAGAGKATNSDSTLQMKAKAQYRHPLPQWLAALFSAWPLRACTNVATPQKSGGEMGHAAIAVQRLERSMEWYEGAFGFKQIGEVYHISTDDSPLGKVARALFGPQEKPMRLAQIATPNGISLELFEFNGQSATAPSAISGILHMAFVVEDFETAQARLGKLGASPVVENFANPTRKVAFYKDPDGHIIELSSRHWDTP